MIDIHSHIIPSVDDGSRDMGESLEMLKISASSGVSRIVATPHFRDFDSRRVNVCKQGIETLNKLAKENDIDIKVLLGSEIFVSPDTLFLIKQKEVLSINDSKHLLVEFGFFGESWWIECALQEIIEAGYIPVMAHPERYGCVQENSRLLEEWLSWGALVQVNADSLFGSFGRGAESCAKYLVSNKLCSCIASDAHNYGTRNTDLSETRRYLVRKYPTEYVDDLLVNNPRKIIGLE